MFIIFDLDDTLIDTSGFITPYKLQQCARIFGVKQEALLEENRIKAKAQEAIVSFAIKNGLESKVDDALSELKAPLPPHFKVPLIPCAKDVLNHFKKRCNLGLVTMGDSSFQQDKLKKSGIDSSLFSMIRVLERAEKKLAYEEIQEKFLLEPKSIWVCGDRIDTDLRPAHELGFHTVHMRWGRGLKEKHEDWIDHTIDGLEELKERIK